MDQQEGQQKVVWAARHGLSHGNISSIVLGHDCALTDEGERQAALLAERCREFTLEAIICSHFKRARQTAEPIAAATGAPIIECDLFGEFVHPSHTEGRSKRDPAFAEYRLSLWRDFHDADVRHGDAENGAILFRRAQAAVAYLEGRPEYSFMVVSHGDFLRVLTALLLYGHNLTLEMCGVIARGFAIANTGLSKFRYHVQKDRPAWRMLYWNDLHHLGIEAS